MIRAGQPENFLAIHARLAGEDVLDRVVENVAKREHAGDIRRRDDDGIRRLRRFRIRDEKLSVEPELIPLVLDGLRFVSFGNFAHAENFSGNYFKLAELPEMFIKGSSLFNPKATHHDK